MSDVKPALTPEEWAQTHPEDEVWDLWEFVMDVGVEGGNSRHALAALCLHGQPFGFTREDVATIRQAIVYDPTTGRHSMALESLAARLEALLPPEGA